MKIKVLGPRCANCKTLEARTREALTQLNVNAEIENVEDYDKIISYGIMRTPGLVIDEKVVVSGRVSTVEEIKKFVNSHLQ
jgi:small redox-active disulfide protein 2